MSSRSMRITRRRSMRPSPGWGTFRTPTLQGSKCFRQISPPTQAWCSSRPRCILRCCGLWTSIRRTSARIRSRATRSVRNSRLRPPSRPRWTASRRSFSSLPMATQGARPARRRLSARALRSSTCRSFWNGQIPRGLRKRCCPTRRSKRRLCYWYNALSAAAPSRTPCSRGRRSDWTSSTSSALPSAMRRRPRPWRRRGMSTSFAKRCSTECSSQSKAALFRKLWTSCPRSSCVSSRSAASRRWSSSLSGTGSSARRRRAGDDRPRSASASARTRCSGRSWGCTMAPWIPIWRRC
mmetsp:Transcript_530/g.1780  ORF Transcript_530/g.1780 Transcript_530/m.1780 type:complete len:295 (+) Transcript_530:1059-1943(+)